VVEKIKLTDKEYQIMSVLWESENPITAAEIVESSDNPSWKEKSIYIIMNSLLKKGVVEMVYHKPTGTNNARAYTPTITSEDCILSHIAAVEETGVRIDIPTLVKGLIKKAGG